jgi:hypothetical protein
LLTAQSLGLSRARGPRACLGRWCVGAVWSGPVHSGSGHPTPQTPMQALHTPRATPTPPSPPNTPSPHPARRQHLHATPDNPYLPPLYPPLPLRNPNTPLPLLCPPFQESTDGSWIEAKESGLVWHYRDADPDFGNWQARWRGEEGAVWGLLGPMRGFGLVWRHINVTPTLGTGRRVGGGGPVAAAGWGVCWG